MNAFGRRIAQPQRSKTGLIALIVNQQRCPADLNIAMLLKRADDCGQAAAKQSLKFDIREFGSGFVEEDFRAFEIAQLLFYLAWRN